MWEEKEGAERVGGHKVGDWRRESARRRRRERKTPN